MNDKLMFCSNSADAKIGRGKGETVINPKDYTELGLIKDWRKALSNFYIAPFRLDDNEWNSVEHFFHAVKFRNNKIASKNYEFYKTFTVNGEKPWSKNAKFATQAGKAGRISIRNDKKYVYDGIIDGDKIPQNVQMRQDFYTSKVDSRVQKIAFLAKFTQHDDLKRLLLSTGDAELWHCTENRGKDNPTDEGNPEVKKGIILEELMIVRDCIRKFDQKCNLAEASQFSSEFITNILE